PSLPYTALHSFPTRRSSDLGERFKVSHLGWDGDAAPLLLLVRDHLDDRPGARIRGPHEELQEALNHSELHTWGIVANARRLRIVNRKSTRLNSSHVSISYAV